MINDMIGVTCASTILFNCNTYLHLISIVFIAMETDSTLGDTEKTECAVSLARFTGCEAGLSAA